MAIDLGVVELPFFLQEEVEALLREISASSAGGPDQLTGYGSGGGGKKPTNGRSGGAAPHNHGGSDGPSHSGDSGGGGGNSGLQGGDRPGEGQRPLQSLRGGSGHSRDGGGSGGDKSHGGGGGNDGGEDRRRSGDDDQRSTVGSTTAPSGGRRNSNPNVPDEVVKEVRGVTATESRPCAQPSAVSPRLI